MDLDLDEAAKILANGVNSIGVYGDQAVEPWHVTQIAREWQAFKAKQAPTPPKRTIWQRFGLGKTSQQGESK